MTLPGSYANGFAPRDGQPLYPELWRGCVGAWAPCLGPTGLTLRDWSGFKNHGTLTNGPSWQPSKGKHAVICDGVNDYIAMPFPTRFTGGSYTISAWVQPVQTAQNLEYIIDFESPRLIIATRNNAGGQLSYFDGSWKNFGNTPYGTVCHLCWVLNKATSTGQIYLNGSPIGSAGVWAGINPGTAFRIASNTLGTDFPFGGSIYDVMLYDRALPQQTVSLLASRIGIAYELAPRRRASSGIAFNRRRRLLVGA